MSRLALSSFVLGALAGCIAAYQEAPPRYPMPTTTVAKALRCWPIGAPAPGYYGVMVVLDQDSPSRLAVLGRNGQSVLVGQFGSLFCILGEGAGA
jgi:hypothetical protein